MGTTEELSTLEEQGWRALSTGGDAATAFYGEVLDDTAVMLLPGGMALTERDTIIRSMAGRPWSAFELDDVRVLRPADDLGVVAYGVTAHREGEPAYSALISSHYVRRDGGWRLFFHQQTPR
ncbi:nuclear transport factor 2 family protein [Actinosynnema sp. CS-041913]|uniref:nuclear transport factor 2 family protein n=1 Tax=Actinosynnema sp. CS-041913 TaxID=3239917 RepID=UPI003D928A67